MIKWVLKKLKFIFPIDNIVVLFNKKVIISDFLKYTNVF